jgi:hypothetical protein
LVRRYSRVLGIMKLKVVVWSNDLIIRCCIEMAVTVQSTTEELEDLGVKGRQRKDPPLRTVKRLFKAHLTI